ncbi:MAG TPA: hypothetical protein VES66_05860 [Terriglobales bacterium]|nr:hypothetical protein [Terriglobales bacterium]
MNCRLVTLWLGIVVTLALWPPAVRAQTDCDKGAGPLRPEQPQGLAPQEIIQKFTAKESAFKTARKSYTFTQDVIIQTLRAGILPGDFRVDGEYRQVMEVSFDPKGRRLEHVTFAPQSSLRLITLSPEDLEDIRERMSFNLGAEDLPLYTLLYAGQQHVDQLDTYVFDVAPKAMQHDRRYFQGRIWVESADLVVVKTCGKTVPDVVRPKKKKRGDENIHPRFVTYREQIDGQYWFPTYTRSDDVLSFSGGNTVRVRETIKYTGYQRSDPKPREVRGEALSGQKPTR